MSLPSAVPPSVGGCARTALGDELEDFISLKEAARLVKCTYKSSRRYAARDAGFRGIVLKTARVGKKIVTTRKWIIEFIDSQTRDIDLRLADRDEQRRALEEAVSSSGRNDDEIQAARERVHGAIGMKKGKED